jgi:hypothetical protein
MKDEDFLFLVSVLEGERCKEVREINLSSSKISDTSLDLIAEKFKSLKKIVLRSCNNISDEVIKKFKCLLLLQICTKSQSGLVILALFGLIQVW